MSITFYSKMSFLANVFTYQRFLDFGIINKNCKPYFIFKVPFIHTVVIILDYWNLILLKTNFPQNFTQEVHSRNPKMLTKLWIVTDLVKIMTENVNWKNLTWSVKIHKSDSVRKTLQRTVILYYTVTILMSKSNNENKCFPRMKQNY